MKLISDGQAKRIAHEFGPVLDRFRKFGDIHDEDIHAVASLARPEAARDPQGWEADRRAILDYLIWYGPRTRPEWWRRLLESEEVVPWAYKRQTRYRPVPE